MRSRFMLFVAVSLTALLQAASAEAQTIDTQCVKTGAVVNCRSKVDENSSNSGKSSQETWNRIYDNQRRTEDAEDRIRQSQQRVAEMEAKSKEDHRNYMIYAMSARSKKLYIERVNRAFNEGRCTDAIYLSLMWNEDETGDRINKNCKNSKLELRSKLREEKGIPAIYTATMAVTDKMQASEYRGAEMLMDLIDKNDPDALFSYSNLFTDGIFPHSESKMYIYLTMADFYYRANINLHSDYLGETQDLTLLSIQKSKELMTISETSKADKIINYCKSYGIAQCRKYFDLFP